MEELNDFVALYIRWAKEIDSSAVISVYDIHSAWREYRNLKALRSGCRPQDQIDVDDFLTVWLKVQKTIADEVEKNTHA